eukprot:1018993-Pelagomonas_calceolata.AAC.1
MEIGVTNLFPLLNDSLTHIIDGNKLTALLGHKVKTRHIIALNKLSHILNSPNLTTDIVNTLIQSQDSSPNKPSELRYINDIIYEEISKPEHTPSGWD